MKRRSLLLLTLIAAAAACEREDRERNIGVTPVRLEAAKRSAFTPSLSLLGIVRAAETFPLTVQRSGTVIYAHRFAGGLRTGERVRADEPIAEVRNDQTEFANRQAKLQLEASEADLDRKRRGYDLGVSTSVELASAQAQANLAREQFRATTRDLERQRIAAPHAGALVISKAVANGVSVDGGTSLGDIVAGTRRVIESTVAANDRAQLRPGQIAHLSHESWKGEGRIAEVASVIDAAGTARVVIDISGVDAPPPGTGIDVVVDLDRQPEALTVPEDAIVAGSEGPAVYIVGSPEGGRRYRAKRAAVTTGGRANGRVEIRSGLRDGDRVVVSGADSLSEGAMIMEAENKP
jgi:multidrug efflux system membrane fusion protein